MSFSFCGCASGRGRRSESADRSPYTPAVPAGTSGPRRSTSAEAIVTKEDDDDFEVPSIFRPIQVDSPALTRVSTSINTGRLNDDSRDEAHVASSISPPTAPPPSGFFEQVPEHALPAIGNGSREDECDSIHSQSSRTLSSANSAFGDPEAEEPLLGRGSQLELDEDDNYFYSNSMKDRSEIVAPPPIESLNVPDLNHISTGTSSSQVKMEEKSSASSSREPSTSTHEGLCLANVNLDIPFADATDSSRSSTLSGRGAPAFSQGVGTCYPTICSLCNAPDPNSNVGVHMTNNVVCTKLNAVEDSVDGMLERGWRNEIDFRNQVSSHCLALAVPVDPSHLTQRSISSSEPLTHVSSSSITLVMNKTNSNPKNVRFGQVDHCGDEVRVPARVVSCISNSLDMDVNVCDDKRLSHTGVVSSSSSSHRNDNSSYPGQVNRPRTYSEGANSSRMNNSKEISLSINSKPFDSLFSSTLSSSSSCPSSTTLSPSPSLSHLSYILSPPEFQCSESHLEQQQQRPLLNQQQQQQQQRQDQGQSHILKILLLSICIQNTNSASMMYSGIRFGILCVKDSDVRWPLTLQPLLN